MSATFSLRLGYSWTLAFVLAGCSADSVLAPVPPPEVADIAITTAVLSVARGRDLQIAAVPKAANGTELRDRGVSFSSLTPLVATVSTSGLLRGLAEGVADIRVSSGDVTRSVAITVTAPPLSAIRTSASAITLDEGGQESVTAVALNELGEEVPGEDLSWISLSPTVATVEHGAITALAEGTATIRVSAGQLVADVVVAVRPVFAGDLLFSSADGAFGAPRIYRMTGVDYSTTRVVRDINGFSMPSVSPDGTRLAYTCPGSGPAICVANIDGTNSTMLTAEEHTYEDQPSWSPDGSKIAFRRYSAIGGLGPWNPSDIWVMNADGSGQVNLTNDSHSQHWPAWSPLDKPGAREIAFVQDSLVEGYETSRVALMSETGADRRVVTVAGLQVVDRPQWMPGGAALLFTRNGGESQHELRVVSIRSGSERAFLAEPLPPGGQFHPTVSPNGRYVVFASQHQQVGDGWVPQIYTARVDGTDVRLRSTGTHGKGQFAWVPTP